MTDNQPQSLFGTPAFLANPFPVYQQLRAQCPFHRTTTANGEPITLVARYVDVQTILKDDSRFTVDMTRMLPPEISESFLALEHVRIQMQSMLMLDGEEHHRLRRLVQKAFTPRLVEQLRPRIQAIADELLDQVQGRESIDLVSDFAFPLPVIVIAELLGLPIADRAQFRIWSDGFLNSGETLEEMAASEPLVAEFSAYFRTIFAERRQHPRQDLISALLHIEDEGSRLTETELIAMVILLLVAGHETTANLITNSMVTLFQHPDQLAILRQQPDLIPTAVEEFLRYSSAVQSPVQRFATEPVQIGEETIVAGEQMIVLLGSANRDEQLLVNPESFDVTRPPTRHLAFGIGVHYCLGAPLARLEMEIALSTLLRRLPNLRPAVPLDQLMWIDSTGGAALLRGLHHLPVVL